MDLWGDADSFCTKVFQPNTNGRKPGDVSSPYEGSGEQIPWESPIPFESVDVASFPTDSLPPVQRLFVEASALLRAGQSRLAVRGAAHLRVAPQIADN